MLLQKTFSNADKDKLDKECNAFRIKLARFGQEVEGSEHNYFVVADGERRQEFFSCTIIYYDED